MRNLVSGVRRAAQWKLWQNDNREDVEFHLLFTRLGTYMFVKKRRKLLLYKKNRTKDYKVKTWRRQKNIFISKFQYFHVNNLLAAIGSAQGQKNDQGLSKVLKNT